MTERRGGVQTPLRLLRETAEKLRGCNNGQERTAPMPIPLVALCVAMGLVLLAGHSVIRCLAALCRESIRKDSPKLAALSSAKAGTPTMGGLLMMPAFLAAVALFADVSQPLVVATIALTLGFGAIGVWDDLSKRNTRRRGISARAKLTGQTILATMIVGGMEIASQSDGSPLSMIAAVLMIVGMSNAVNLTDGLDGLAGGCSFIVLAVLGLACSIAAQESQLTTLVSALAGAVLGLLWFNRHPARVFMGDTGSLPLGGLIGLFVAASGFKLAGLIACGVFAVEAASVALQVGWFRSTGRRIFLCAPLHHHFQFLGWPERRIVGHFWLASLLCAGAGLAIFLRSQP